MCIFQILSDIDGHCGIPGCHICIRKSKFHISVVCNTGILACGDTLDFQTAVHISIANCYIEIAFYRGIIKAAGISVRFGKSECIGTDIGKFHSLNGFIKIKPVEILIGRICADHSFGSEFFPFCIFVIGRIFVLQLKGKGIALLPFSALQFFYCGNC